MRQEKPVIGTLDNGDFCVSVLPQLDDCITCVATLYSVVCSAVNESDWKFSINTPDVSE